MQPRLRDVLELVRLPNLFTAAGDPLLGFFVGAELSGVPALQAAWNFSVALMATVAASVLLYAAGVVLNDVFDVEIDRRQRPDRPLPSGRLSVAFAKLLGCELLAGGVAACVVGAILGAQPKIIAVGLLLAVLVVWYDYVHKRTWLAPVLMGACRMLNVLLGASALPGATVSAFGFRAAELLVAGAIGIYVVGLTCFAAGEAAPMARGRQLAATIIVYSGPALLGLLPRMPLVVHCPPGWWLLLGFFALLLAVYMLKAVIFPTPAAVQKAVKRLVLSLITLDAIACFGVAGTAPAVLILLLLVPAATASLWFRSA